MTNRNSESGDITESESASDALKFSLQETVTNLTVTAIDPQKASEYTLEKVSNSRQVRGYNKKQFQEDIHTSDAMAAGWIIHSPFAFRVEETGRNTYELHVPEQPDDIDVIQLTELGGDPVVIVNTLWNVTLPNEYSLLLTTPFVTIGTDPETAPKHINPTDEDSESLTSLLRVNGEFAISKGGAVGQLIPIPSDIPNAGYRAATDTELSEIQKAERRAQIYPNSYRQNRDHNRTGKLLNHQ